MEPSTTTAANPSRGPIALAIVASGLAIIVAIFALGRALASPVQPTVGRAAAAATDDAASAAPASVAVALSEFAISPDPIVVAHGGTLEVSNVGAAEHNLKVKDTEVGTGTFGAGGSESLDLTALDPGDYAVWCDIPGHEAGGMEATLTITGSDDEHATAHGGGGTGSDVEAHADPAAMAEAMEASIAAFPAETEGTGAQVMEPTILEDGTKQFTLVADELQWEVEPGRIVDAMAYNGQIPGPTLELEVGDRVSIVVENQLEEIHSLHNHGVIGLPFEMDGVGGVSQEPIMPGETFTYEFVAEELSVGMYHAHDMGVHQVPNGLIGAILVGQVPTVGVDVSAGGEHIMMLNDAGNIGYALNGKSFPATTPYVLKQGESMLVHYMNEGLMPHPMHLHGNRQLVVAKDGFPLDSPYYADTINVAPGERYSVVVTAEKPGVWVWHCHILTHVEKSDGSMFGMLTALIVE